MAKIRNVSGEARWLPVYGRQVEAGDTLEIPDDDLSSFVLQTSLWAPVGNEARHAAKEAKAKADTAGPTVPIPDATQAPATADVVKESK